MARLGVFAAAALAAACWTSAFAAQPDTGAPPLTALAPAPSAPAALPIEPPPACAGTDLLEAARRTDPAAYASIVARTAEIPNAEGLLWRVEKGGVAPSYLFGTMHVTDDEAVGFARSMAKYLRDTRTVATELGDAASPAMQTALAVKVGLRALSSKVSAASLITSKEDQAHVGQLLGRLHVDLATALRMPPWLLATMLSVPACEVERQKRALPIVDHVIEDIGKSFGAKLVGLETVDEQLDALAGLDPQQAARMIVLTAGKESFAEDSFATMVALYREQRIGAILPTLEIATKLGPEDVEADRAFMAGIVEKRNLVMRQRAEPLIDAGPVFVAVGAMHLVGKQGLVELLRQDGYRVTRVQ